MNKDRLILIDGSSYFFRAYYAIQSLSTSQGFPTNAIYGFVNMLAKVLETEKPKQIAIVFDSKTPTFRKEMYKEYKANRGAPPEDLVVQIPHIQRAVDCFQIQRLQKDGFEADDVIATVVQEARSKGLSVDIISGDKDLMQLVNGTVQVFDPMKDRRFDSTAVKEKFGVGPEQMVDLLALMGDSSDNVPGVAGIGAKTAATLLNEYGSLDGLYENLEKIKQPKRRATLEEQKDQAYLSRDLVELRKDVEVDFDWGDLTYKGPNKQDLASFFQEMEFNNMIQRFELEGAAPAASGAPQEKGEYSAVTTEAELKKVLKELAKAPLIAVDTETTSLTPHSAEMVGISLSAEKGKAFYIPVGHVPAELEEAPKQLDPDTARKHLKPFFEDTKIKKVGQNLKYDIQILRKWGVELHGIEADTLVASYLIDPDQSHGLDKMAQRHLNHTNISYEELCGKGKSQISFAEVPVERATDYAAEDADITLRLYEEKLADQVKGGNLEELFNDVEVPLVEVLADMEYFGVSVDEKRLQKMAGMLEKELAEVVEKTHELAGEEFNLNSPKQLGKILFEKLELPVIKKTKTGYSTDESVLQELSSQHEIADWLLKNRELTKLKSTYVDGLLAQIHPDTKRIHTQFNQTVAATGRLSSSNPNLQNIPVPKNPQYNIRSVFVAPKGTELMAADYSQVELRVLAHMSEDEELMRAFRNEEDVHSYTARLIFDGEKVTSEQRSVAKTINFGVIYGQTPYGLSRQLKISPKEAKAFIESYFQRYAGVKRFLEKTVEEARSNGYVTTLLGRRRFLKELSSKNHFRREMAERTATNTPIQGTAADMIKVAMVAIHQRLRGEKLKSKMILQVHDELVFEVVKSEKDVVESLVRQEMEKALELKVPLRVDMNSGETWAKS